MRTGVEAPRPLMQLTFAIGGAAALAQIVEPGRTVEPFDPEFRILDIARSDHP